MIKCECGGYIEEFGDLPISHNPCVCNKNYIKKLEKKITYLKKNNNDSIKDEFRKMSDDERMEIIENYCHNCGTNKRPCYCEIY